ncbi:hypothetical protein F4780DRAFT_737231 [Xylariomycetidae sp. FL0641]|nr:hypothetical protein F4780DRAFT_737231 [Xylariomycetidae sp. FL0641]
MMLSFMVIGIPIPRCWLYHRLIVTTFHRPLVFALTVAAFQLRPCQACPSGPSAGYFYQGSTRCLSQCNARAAQNI